MEKNALSVNGLTKKYHDFMLDEVSFHVSHGTIVGLIGENGAGKSTTMKAILGLIKNDAGSIELLGQQAPNIDFTTRNKIGVVFDGNNFPDTLSPRKLGELSQKVYVAWDEKQYAALLERWSLPLNKKIRNLSKGMKVKLSIAVALSHHSELLILDEATSGLDPVARDDILDMLLEFVQNEHHAVSMSSHMTNDLEKIADTIVFLHNGKVLFSKPKDELRYQYGIMKCGTQQFEALDQNDRIAYRKQDYEWQVLVADRHAAQRKYPNAVIDPATIDDIMLLFLKGETK